MPLRVWLTRGSIRLGQLQVNIPLHKSRAHWLAIWSLSESNLYWMMLCGCAQGYVAFGRLLGGSSKVDILIATPGRLMDHLHGTRNFSLQHLRFLVRSRRNRPDTRPVAKYAPTT